MTTPSRTTHIKHLNDLENLTPTPPHSHRVYDGTLYSSAYFKEGLHSTSSSTTTSLDCEARLYKEHLTIRCRNIIDAAGQHRLSADLNLPTRVSPPYSHQSQGKVERFHRNLFDQLRTTRLQWSKDLKVEPHMLPPESLPWALQHSVFILNNYLVHSSGKTSHFENYRYNYRSNIVGFGEVVLGDIRNIPTQKLRLRNQHQSSEASGLDVISSPMSTSLHYLCSTVNIHLQQQEHTSAGRSLVYLVKNNMTSTF